MIFFNFAGAGLLENRMSTVADTARRRPPSGPAETAAEMGQEP